MLQRVNVQNYYILVLALDELITSGNESLLHTNLE
jgi:hypothetical protein